jgi:cyclopropane-fatty-acyl-phospholipid synthase
MKLERAIETPMLPFIDQATRGILFKKLKLIQEGYLEISENYGRTAQVFQFGNPEANAELRAKILILDPSAYSRIVFGGSIGAGESYMEGLWESSDLTKLIRIFARTPELHLNLDSGLGAILAPIQKLFHRLRRNSIEGSEKNIHAHYDIGNDFFELFLDDSYMYSSGVFLTKTSTLEDAQFEKNDRICRKLKLTANDHLLEIGTGWGGFAIHAAKHFGCKITTTTISKEQFALAKERVAKEGLTDRIELLFQDYRLLTGTYDKIVSIEMIEAVGLDHLDEYFAKCSSLLKPEGQMLLQAITIRDQQYESARKSVDFIQRYIFPGSGIPSVAAMSRSILTKTDFQVAHLEDFGEHYAKTLGLWSERLAVNHQKVLQRQYPETLYRMWQFYFSYCEGGFSERSIGVAQILLNKPMARANSVLGKF